MYSTPLRIFIGTEIPGLGPSTRTKYCTSASAVCPCPPRTEVEALTNGYGAPRVFAEPVPVPFTYVKKVAFEIESAIASDVAMQSAVDANRMVARLGPSAR